MNQNPERPKDMDEIMNQIFSSGEAMGRIDERIKVLDNQIEKLNLKIALLRLGVVK